MSFSDRMRRVETPEELDQLITEVRQQGSGNWTLSTAQERVPQHLWAALEEHFSSDGIILDWVEGEEPSVEQAFRLSLVATIRQLQRDARAARERAANEHQERLAARRSEEGVESEAPEAVGPSSGEEGKLSQEETPVASPTEPPSQDVAGPSVDEAPEPPKPSPRAGGKRRKRKRRLVKRPEDLRTGLRKTEPEQTPTPARALEIEHDEEKTSTQKAEPPAPFEADRDLAPATHEPPEPAEPETQKTDAAADQALHSHAFDGGWCTTCGISIEVAREHGWGCDAVETSPSTGQSLERARSGRAASHAFDGDWCTRCGLSREQGSKFMCN